MLEACQAQNISCAMGMHLHKRDGYSWKPLDLYAWFVLGEQIEPPLYPGRNMEEIVWLRLPVGEDSELPLWVKAWGASKGKFGPNPFGGYCDNEGRCICLTQGCWDANGWFLSRKIRNGRLAQITWQIGLIEEGAFVPLVKVEFVPKKFEVGEKGEPFGIPDNWYIGGTYKIKAQPVSELEK